MGSPRALVVASLLLFNTAMSTNAFDVDALNPYQAPRARRLPGAESPSGERALARRSSRLAAVAIDYLVVIVPTGPTLAAYLWLERSGGADSALAAITNGYALLLAAFVAGQAWLLGRTGQTLGKRLLGIRIVDSVSGEPVPWKRLLFTRYVLNIVLRQVPFYFLVDALFIFGSRRRCIHDRIARTEVISVNP